MRCCCCCFFFVRREYTYLQRKGKGDVKQQCECCFQDQLETKRNATGRIQFFAPCLHSPILVESTWIGGKCRPFLKKVSFPGAEERFRASQQRMNSTIRAEQLSKYQEANRKKNSPVFYSMNLSTSHVRTRLIVVILGMRSVGVGDKRFWGLLHKYYYNRFRIIFSENSFNY